LSAIAAPATLGVWPRLRRPGIQLLAGVLILAAWQGAAAAWTPDFVARPSGIVRVLPSTLSDGVFWTDAKITVLAVVEGLALGVVLGAMFGVLMGRLRDFDAMTRFYVSAFFAMPLIALVPVMTLWFGYTGTVRLAIVTLEAFLPVCLNVYDGTRKLPAQYVEVARSYHARWWNVWFGIGLRASVPYLLGGFRLAAGRALVAAVVAEYIVALQGLGYFILFQSRALRQNEAMVAVILLALLGTTFNSGADLVTRRLLPWYRRS
jgi:ABC-type nitrate/sulfonate/bicarbonate transport system permease component